MKVKTEGSSIPAASDHARGTAGTALAAGGLLAAFGVASCCALPIALSSLGISAASLLGVGYVAAQYQRELFYVAVVCLAAAAYVAWRQRQARACGACAATPTPGGAILFRTSVAAIMLAIMLLALTFWYEPPI